MRSILIAAFSSLASVGCTGLQNFQGPMEEVDDHTIVDRHNALMSGGGGHKLVSSVAPLLLGQTPTGKDLTVEFYWDERDTNGNPSTASLVTYEIATVTMNPQIVDTIVKRVGVDPTFQPSENMWRRDVLDISGLEAGRYFIGVAITDDEGRRGVRSDSVMFEYIVSEIPDPDPPPGPMPESEPSKPSMLSVIQVTITQPANN